MLCHQGAGCADGHDPTCVLQLKHQGSTCRFRAGSTDIAQIGGSPPAASTGCMLLVLLALLLPCSTVITATGRTGAIEGAPNCLPTFIFPPPGRRAGTVCWQAGRECITAWLVLPLV